MKKTTLNDVMLFHMKQLIEPNGNLLPIEFDNEIPFKPKRTFFITSVPNESPRGQHAHHKTKQLLVCASGEIHVKLHDGKNEATYKLKQGQAIYVPNLIWDEQIYKSTDSVLVSLCNTHFDLNDYIFDFDDFKRIKNG